MAYKKLHFLFDPKKPESKAFAKKLIKFYGQEKPAQAEAIICIGGDGLLLQGLKGAAGKPVFGLTPPGSNSNGFWTAHGIRSPKALPGHLKAAESVPLNPIEGDIRFCDGAHRKIHAFGDIVVRPGKGQAVIMNLTAHFNRETLGPLRLIGDGMIFSTPLGSTGHSRSYGAPAVDLHADALVATPLGFYEPSNAPPIVSQASRTVLDIEFVSAGRKRPVAVSCDGRLVSTRGHGSIMAISIRSAPEKSVPLLVAGEASVKAYAALVKK
jgi:NAD+ kinase